MSAVSTSLYGGQVAYVDREYSEPRVIEYSPVYREQVIAIAQEMHADSMFRDYAFDPDKLIAQLELAAKHPDTAYFRIAVRDGEVFGGFYGTVSRMFFCDELMARDVGWWVKKSRRGSWAAMALLEGFEQWAAERGALKAMIGQSSEIDIDKTSRLYRHCGYRIVGYNAVKDI